MNNKYIVIYSRPVKAAYSLYWQKRYSFAELARTFEEALLLNDQRVTGLSLKIRKFGKIKPDPFHMAYLEMSRHSFYLNRAINMLSNANIFTIDSSMLSKNPKQVFDKVMQFLDLESSNLEFCQYTSNKAKVVRSHLLSHLLFYGSSIKRCSGTTRKVVEIF